MPARFDAATLETLIENGRRRDVSSKHIADEILTLLEDPAWVKAMGHPARAQIIRLLGEHGQLSPATALGTFDGMSLQSLAYHFQALLKLGVIELSDTIRRRGAVEHVYRLAG